MKFKPEKITKLIEEIDALVLNIREAEARHQDILDGVCDSYKKSARNLLHYLIFRQVDLRLVQKKLGHLGLSRLAKAEGHVMASLLNSRHILGGLMHEENQKVGKSGLSIKNGEKLLVNHTKELLGFRSKGRRVRIMVTQPTEAAYNYALVHDMAKSGMNCARINCAHDGPDVWKKIIDHIKKASKSLGREIKITMDLAGPKIRTGAIQPGPKVRKFTPERDEVGRVVNPASILFVKELTEESENHCLPLPEEWLKQLEQGDKIKLTDPREKQRTLKVIQKFQDGLLVNCYETSYIGTGTLLKPERGDLPEVSVGDLPPIEQYLLLRVNDRLTIHRDGIMGEPA
ncbi:MAG: pyruvate kinase, partial [Bacteroidota bacterium]